MLAKFKPSEEYRKQRLIEWAEEVPYDVTCSVPLVDLSTSVRAALTKLPTTYDHHRQQPVVNFTEKVSERENHWYAPFVPETPDQWSAIIRLYGDLYAAFHDQIRQNQQNILDGLLHQMRAGDFTHAYLFKGMHGLVGFEEAQALIHAYEQARDARNEEERKARIQRQREIEDEQRRARIAKDEEKAAWIKEHGSAYLQRAYGEKYDCQRLYVRERAALEYPGFRVDFDDKAEWDGRSCPSELALTEAERVKGRVIWLTREPFDAQDPPMPEVYLDFEPCEAVVIREYLGKYDLIKVI